MKQNLDFDILYNRWLPYDEDTFIFKFSTKIVQCEHLITIFSIYIQSPFNDVGILGRVLSFVLSIQLLSSSNEIVYLINYAGILWVWLALQVLERAL